MDRSSRPKVNEIDLTTKLTSLSNGYMKPSTGREYTISSSKHRIFIETDHVPDHRGSLNKFKD